MSTLKAMPGLSQEPARGRDQLDLEAVVIEDVEQRLTGIGVLEFARLLLHDNAVEGSNDGALGHRSLGGGAIGLGLLDFRSRDIKLELTG